MLAAVLAAGVSGLVVSHSLVVDHGLVVSTDQLSARTVACLRVQGAGMDAANGLYAQEELEGYAGPLAYHKPDSSMWIFRWHQTWWHLASLQPPLLSEEAFTDPVIYTSLVQEPRELPPKRGWTGDVMRGYGPMPAPTISSLGQCAIQDADETYPDPPNLLWLGPTPYLVDEESAAQLARTRRWSPLLGSPPLPSFDALVFGCVALVLLSLLCTCRVITHRDHAHKNRELRFCPHPKSSRLPGTRRAMHHLKVNAVQVRAAPLHCRPSHAPSLAAHSPLWVCPGRWPSRAQSPWCRRPSMAASSRTRRPIGCNREATLRGDHCGEKHGGGGQWWGATSWLGGRGDGGGDEGRANAMHGIGKCMDGQMHATRMHAELRSRGRECVGEGREQGV